MNSHAAQSGNWVDARMAALSPNQEWQPDVANALVRLREQQAARIARRRSIATRLAALVVLACFSLAAFRPTRWMVRHYLEGSLAFLRSVSTSGAVRASNLVPEKDRKAAANFTLSDASGKPVSLTDFRGKVVLLNFWATWCHGCILEVPWFVEFDNDYRAKGLGVIGISMDDGWTDVHPFLAEKKVKYTIVLGNDEARKQYALGAMPMTLLIDRQGRIAATHVGVVSKTDRKSEIDALLSEK